MENVLILGSGVSGMGACKLAIKQKLNIRVSDSNKILKKNKVLFQKFNIFWEEDQHSFSNLDWADYIIKSPGISNQIDFIKANGVYLEVYYGKEKVLTRSNIPSFIDKLPEDQFCRIHKSYVINMKKIKVISPKFVEISDEQIPIGRQYKAGFFEALEKLNM